MKRIWTIAAMIMFFGFSTGLIAQNIEDPVNHADQENHVRKPEVEIKVQRETDENGNISRYDSTYSWSSDGILSENFQEKLDSIVEQFNLRGGMTRSDSLLSNHDFRNLLDGDVLKQLEDMKYQFKNFDDQFFNDFREKLQNLFNEEFLGEMREHLNDNNPMIQEKQRDFENRMQDYRPDKENHLTRPGGKAI